MGSVVSRWAWAVGLLVMPVAGCTSAADPGAAPRTSASATVWRGFAGGCPTLRSSPYGISPSGERSASHVSPGEQDMLDEVAPGAQFDKATCQYSALSGLTPNITAYLTVFRGERGATQAQAMFEKVRSAKSTYRMDYAEVPGPGDSAFAWYFEPDMYVAARSGNAYVTIRVVPGAQASETFDKLQPLEQQIPALAAVRTDVLTTLQ